MTNEEKAREIANNCSTKIVGAEVSDETYITTEPDCYTAAMTMAKWKDEQSTKEKQALIDKACEWLRKNIESDKYLSPDEESYRMGCGVDYLETNMFIEDFKNYMKGGENENDKV